MRFIRRSNRKSDKLSRLEQRLDEIERTLDEVKTLVSSLVRELVQDAGEGEQDAERLTD